MKERLGRRQGQETGKGISDKGAVGAKTRSGSMLSRLEIQEGDQQC